MANTFFGLTIGKSGLYAYQAAMNTTAHNSSNVDTVGYSRQQTVRSASAAISISGSWGMQGTGTDVFSIDQMRNIYYDEKYWANCSVYGNYSSKSYYMQSIQGYYSETNSKGITSNFDSFFLSLQELKKSVNDNTVRTQVAEFGNTLTDTINTIYSDLQTLQKECNADIKNTADQINSLSQRITSLTKQINTIEINGIKANDLRDARNLLIDELSSLANITVSETPVGDGIGVNQYIVRLDGKVLVDTYNYSTLKAVPKESSVNMNDADGLYTLQWSDGQTFDSGSSTLGGKLQALFEVRDGNNKLNFNGTANGTAGGTKLTVTNANINDILKLNLPASDGEITVDGKTYYYKSFTYDVQTETYEFELKEPLKAGIANKEAKVGESVDYKGIPYYMSQLNEFARTFAQAFNKLHTQGKDLNNDMGMDFFTGTVDGTGEEFSFTDPTTGGEVTKVSSLPDSTVKDGNDFVVGSYYNVTAGNMKINWKIQDSPSKIACSENITGTDTGVEDTKILDALIDLKSDMDMFKQGTPDMFLRTIIAEVSIDTNTAIRFEEGQDYVLKSIDQQRMSISGVDSDEEGVDMMKFKNAYDLCSKVISIMNEMYNKLINEMGV